MSESCKWFSVPDVGESDTSCNRPAEYTTCNFDGGVCAEHRCRCSKPLAQSLGSNPNPASNLEEAFVDIVQLLERQYKYYPSCHVAGCAGIVEWIHSLLVISEDDPSANYYCAEHEPCDIPDSILSNRKYRHPDADIVLWLHKNKGLLNGSTKKE